MWQWPRRGSADKVGISRMMECPRQSSRMVTATVSLNTNANLHSGMDLPVGTDVNEWINNLYSATIANQIVSRPMPLIFTPVAPSLGLLLISYDVTKWVFNFFGGQLLVFEDSYSFYLRNEVTPLAVSRQPRATVEEQASVFTTCGNMNI